MKLFQVQAPNAETPGGAASEEEAGKAEARAALCCHCPASKVLCSPGLDTPQAMNVLTITSILSSTASAEILSLQERAQDTELGLTEQA